MIVNFTPGQPGYNDSLFRGSVERFYVDSLSRFYFEGAAFYIAVGDSTGRLLDRLSPFPPDSQEVVKIIGFNSDDVLSIDCRYHGFYTYRNHTFFEGGSPAWLARDGYYYDCIGQDSVTMKFLRFRHPRLSGGADSLQVTLKPLLNGATGVMFLGVDDSLRIYIRAFKEKGDSLFKGIQVFDTQYNLKDEFWFDYEPENRYLWHINEPFLRRDGNVYEFRCLDDGLHVIKWAKQ